MYQRFGLTLVVTHDCNLACGYCYAGRKFNRKMADEIADAALRRAVASLNSGGTLELGFFGGEPLLEAALVERVLGLAEELAHRSGLDLSACLTTNGTVRDATAWRVMRHPRMNLALSFDGSLKSTTATGLSAAAAAAAWCSKPSACSARPAGRRASSA